MIKNIVFDMGRVLLDYDAVRVCWQYTDSSEDVELMSRENCFLPKNGCFWIGEPSRRKRH